MILTEHVQRLYLKIPRFKILCLLWNSTRILFDAIPIEWNIFGPLYVLFRWLFLGLHIFCPGKAVCTSYIFQTHSVKVFLSSGWSPNIFHSIRIVLTELHTKFQTKIRRLRRGILNYNLCMPRTILSQKGSQILYRRRSPRSVGVRHPTESSILVGFSPQLVFVSVFVSIFRGMDRKNNLSLVP